MNGRSDARGSGRDAGRRTGGIGWHVRAGRFCCVVDERTGGGVSRRVIGVAVECVAVQGVARRAGPRGRPRPHPAGAAAGPSAAPAGGPAAAQCAATACEAAADRLDPAGSAAAGHRGPRPGARLGCRAPTYGPRRLRSGVGGGCKSERSTTADRVHRFGTGSGCKSERSTTAGRRHRTECPSAADRSGAAAGSSPWGRIGSDAGFVGPHRWEHLEPSGLPGDHSVRHRSRPEGRCADLRIPAAKMSRPNGPRWGR